MRLSIETDRLVLRLPVPADAPAIARQIGVWEVASMLARAPWPYEPHMADDWLRTQEQTRRAGGGIAFMIAPRETPDEIIGNVSLKDLTREDAELGYWLGMDHWGQGIMTEAARAVVAFAFDVLGLKAVNSGHLKDNPNSGRVLTKLGFSVTGEQQIASLARNESKVPHINMRLEAADWWHGPSAATSL